MSIPHASLRSLALVCSLVATAQGQSLDLTMKGGGIGESLNVKITGPVAQPYLLLMSTQFGAQALPAPHISSIDVGLDLATLSVSIPGFLGLAPANLTYPIPDIASIDGMNLNFQALGVTGAVLASKSNPWRMTFAEPETTADTLNDSDLARAWGTATPMLDGSVLLIGGTPSIAPHSAATAAFSGLGGSKTAERYVPATESFEVVGLMGTARARHAAVRLADGRVLVTGGANGLVATATAEVYDPATGTFSSVGSMAQGRVGHTMNLLPDGRVLVAGGSTSASHQNAIAQTSMSTTELFDPATGTFTAGPGMGFTRTFHSATTLPDGRVVFAGGLSASAGSVFTSASIMTYTPDAGAGKFLNLTFLSTPRAGHGAAVLPNGKVLLAGGVNLLEADIQTTGDVLGLKSAELIDVDAKTSNYAGSLVIETLFPNVVGLDDGDILVSGGVRGTGSYEQPLHLNTRLRYAFGSWFSTGNLSIARAGAGAARLEDGTVGFFHGQFFNGLLQKGAEIYQQ